MIASLDVPGALALSKITPMDVLHVDPEQSPSGMPHVAHSFLGVLGWKRGPMYRHKEYVRVHKEEREHFPWVIEHVRQLAQDFWKQYHNHHEKNGKTAGNLSMQMDAFLTIVVDKLFTLALMEQLPELARRQRLLDTAGCVHSRWRFVREFGSVPPRLEAVAVAFGIDWRRREPNVQVDLPLRLWTSRHLWTRRRNLDLMEKYLPTVDALGDMALATPLRHRPWVSFLADMHSHEDVLLRPWYFKVRPEEPIRHVLWSSEFIRELSTYTSEALQAADHIAGAGVGRAAAGPEGGSTRETMAVLCVGSGSSRLQLYLGHILSRLLPGWDVRVVSMVPAKESKRDARLFDEETTAFSWPSADLSQPPLARDDLTLWEALRLYRPRLVLCTAMPPRVDWSKHFRESRSVLEYLLIGPTDSDRSGDANLTWGRAAAWRNKGQAPRSPDYVRDGFMRRDLPKLSALVLGTDDVPGRVGANAVTSFRRLMQPKLTGAPDRIAIEDASGGCTGHASYSVRRCHQGGSLWHHCQNGHGACRTSS
mmetsp:Transcript_3324/g.8334  ORF Transcript_3324/g.8334 Transcript_3324/m.8334 type:complete len:536 (+) Transcript_3324:2-1609(+)